MVGSDYPYNMGDVRPVDSLEKVGLDEATFKAIMHGNADRFLAR